MEYQIEIYQTDNGKLPYKIWLSSLRDTKAKAIIRLRLDRLRLGNFGNCKSVGDGVFELKIDYGPGYRIYFGKIGRQIVLLLTAGDKSTQSGDLKKAKLYLEDYKIRE
jgi:putative addiction module killer protein